MPLLLMPALLLAFGLAWALLLPLGLWQRYRRGRARRRVQPWVLRANAWLLLASSGMFLLGAWLAGYWVAAAVPHAVLGLLAGVLAGTVGLWLTRFEREDAQGSILRGWGPGRVAGLLTREPAARLYYTANRWLVLGLTVLAAARIGFGLLQVARLWDGADAQVDWLARQGSLLAVAGLLLGHYLAYTWGLRRRLPR